MIQIPLTIGDRLRQVRKSKGLNQEIFAKIGGVTKMTQLKYERNETSPNAEYIVALCAIGVDPSYILTGKTLPAIDAVTIEMFKKSAQMLRENSSLSDSEKKELGISQFIDNVDKNKKSELNEQKGTIVPFHSKESEQLDDLISIPQLDLAFSGGHGQYPEDHPLVLGSRSFSAEWIKKKGLDPNQLSLVRLHGDSMEGKIPNHSILMLDLTKTRPTPSLPVAFRLENELYVKNYQSTGKPDEMAFHSTNPAYPPIIIDAKNPPADFEIVGAVVWHAVSWI